MTGDSAAGSRVTAREVLVLAVPAALAALLQHAFRPLDQFYVGFIGREAQGALGSTTFVVISVWAFFVLISAGVGPLVARATGRGDTETRAQIIGSGFVLGCVVYVGVLLLLTSGMDLVTAALGLEGAVAQQASSYLMVLYLTGAALVFAPIIDASLIAMGNTLLPLVIQTVVLAINAFLTPVCMFYFDMGVSGAALGTTVAQTAGVLVGLFFLARKAGVFRRHLRVQHYPMILRIGAPVAMATAMYSLVYWALLGTSVSQLGPQVNAALGIGFSGLEAMTWPVYMGVSVAVSSIVGRKLGEGRPEEAWRAIHIVYWPQIGLGVFAGVVFYVLGPSIVRPFAADEAVFQEAVVYATVLAFSQPFVSTEALFEGVLSGAGDTKRVFWGTVPYNILRIPLAWLFAFPLGMGAAGVWWAINLTTAAKALVKGWMVHKGEWSILQL